mgnify:CR=1 FL=1
MLEVQRDDTGVWAYPDWAEAFGGAAPEKPPVKIYFRAESLRRQRTGIHGYLGIHGGETGRVFAYDGWVNIGRPEERSRLFKAFLACLSDETIKALPEQHLRWQFGEFCRQSWECWIGGAGAEESGSETEPPPPATVVSPFVIDGGGTILFGDPGTGKSWLLLFILVSVDAGCQALFRVSQRRALLVNLERSRESVERRLWLVNRALGLDPGRRLLCMHRKGSSMADVEEAARDTVQRYNVGLVGLDSISRGGYGSLSDDETANAQGDALNRLRTTWVAVAHEAKANRDSPHKRATAFGSVHFESVADVMCRVKAQVRETDLGVGIIWSKANDVPRFPTLAYRLSFGPVGLTTAAKSSASQWPELTEGRLSLAEEIDTVLLSGKATALEIAQTTDRNPVSVRRELRANPRYVVVGADGKEQVWGVVEGRREGRQ